nr:MAG TPA: hypothetical protein [Caudoviricetes sp.]
MHSLTRKGNININLYLIKPICRNNYTITKIIK